MPLVAGQDRRCFLSGTLADSRRGVVGGVSSLSSASLESSQTGNKGQSSAMRCALVRFTGVADTFLLSENFAMYAGTEPTRAATRSLRC